MPTPIFYAIAAELRSDIAEGRYPAGAKLPTEKDLSVRFGVNRHTVRHALSNLIEEGLIKSRRGAGTFVRAQPTDYPLGRRVRFHQNLLATGRSPEKRILHIETRPASAAEAEPLGLEPGALICAYHAVSLADGSPVALAESLFPQERWPGLADALGAEAGVTAALARVGVEDFVRASTRITARAATALQALHLDIREGAPLIYTTALNTDPSGRPVEFGRTWFVGDRLTLTMDGLQ